MKTKTQVYAKAQRLSVTLRHSMHNQTTINTNERPYYYDNVQTALSASTAIHWQDVWDSLAIRQSQLKG